MFFHLSIQSLNGMLIVRQVQNTGDNKHAIRLHFLEVTKTNYGCELKFGERQSRMKEVFTLFAILDTTVQLCRTAESCSFI